ncbi:MAG: ABC transporter substrate-binding protein, partial [Pseudomonadota bacterium]|nr:ABC transporter substrate-binding protein [Pseudomonadota bacterium]
MKNLENILNLKQYLAIPKIGDAGAPAPTKGVFGRIFLRQSNAAFPGEAPHVPPGTITQHGKSAQGTATRETTMNATIKTLGLAAAFGLAAAPALA